MPLSPGQTFAGYTIIRLLGSGAMGEVYLAQHPRLPRQDALKILRPDVSAEQDYRQRFIREADLAATLWHPNIVAVHDRGEEGDQLWISMDYVDGTDAARLLGDQYPAGMPAGEVADTLTAIASALDNAHQHELLHRDVKPANILLANPVDGERRILLSDFGIARTTGDVSGLTATNMTMGTLPYASPEQLMGKPMDGRADQYSLAATAYHLLTGSPLFRESSPAAVIGSHLTAPPPPLAPLAPNWRRWTTSWRWPWRRIPLTGSPCAGTSRQRSQRQPSRTVRRPPGPQPCRPPLQARHRRTRHHTRPPPISRNHAGHAEPSSSRGRQPQPSPSQPRASSATNTATKPHRRWLSWTALTTWSSTTRNGR